MSKYFGPDHEIQRPLFRTSFERVSPVTFLFEQFHLGSTSCSVLVAPPRSLKYRIHFRHFPGRLPTKMGDVDGDVELSFEMTFSEGTPSRGDYQDESPRKKSESEIRQKEYSASFQEPSAVPLSILSTSAPQGEGSQKRRTRSRKRTATYKTKNLLDKDVPVEKEKTCIFLCCAPAGKKLDSEAILSYIEESVGSKSTTSSYFLDYFGFVQFTKAELATKAVDQMNGIEVGGTEVVVERCARSVPGRDLKASSDATQTVKNTTLVIKNLPFSMKQEKLMLILHAFDEQKPESVAFHHDSSGTFRGMAFAKYRSIQDAVFVFDHINGIDVGGRPIRVEYKRKPDPADDEHQKIQQQLLHFKESDNMSDLAFPYSLTNVQRKQIHMIAEKLGLTHRSYGENEHRYIIVSKKKEEENGKGIQIRKSRGNTQDNGSFAGRSWSDKGSLPSSYVESSSPPGDRDVWRPRSLTGGSWKGGSSWSNNSSPSDSSMPIYMPSRQPKGPDGTNGFSVEYRQARAV